MKSCVNRVLLLAGEESGLLYANELKRRLAGNEIRGYQDCGFETHDLAVMGFLPVLLKIRYFLRVKKTMEKVIDEWRPDVVLTVDYPGLNLKLAAYAHAKGIRTVHVVCPQVWAWKKGRIPKIEATLDRLCCFLPFEPKLFRPGFATFVGHPLALAFANAEGTDGRVLKTDVGVKTVALLPGSRKGEIEKILPTLLKAAVKLHDDFGDKVRFVIPAATPRAFDQIADMLRSSLPVPCPGFVELRHGGARDLLREACCAAVASGTATLEAALARCPTVLVYRMGRMLWWIAGLVLKTRFAGLANVIWERCREGGEVVEEQIVNREMQSPDQPMPELLQENFTAESVGRYLKGYLSDGDVRADAVRRLDSAMAYLRTDGDPFSNIINTL